MTDIVDIGLAVDSRQVDSGRTALGRFAKQSGKTKRATDGLNTSLKHSATAMSALATATAAASAAFAINKIREFEKSISDLSAITGAAGKDLDFLRQKSLEFGATTTLSASQAADAFKLIASAKPDLLGNAEALAKVTRETITLSEAAGIALPEAANALGSSLNQFNAGAAESTRFINVLAAGAKFGSSEIAQTAEALKMAGTVAASAGLSFEQTNAAIQALASVAIKGSEAGTGLRGVLLKLSTQSRDEFNPEIVGFTNAIKNLSGAHLTTTEKTKLFGMESITAANALIKEAGNLGILTGKLTDTNTAYEQSAIRVNNLDGDIKKLMSAVEGAGLSFQKDLNPELRSMVQLLTESVNGFATFISVMSGAKTEIALAVKLQDLREQLKSAEGDFRSLAENGAASFSMFGTGILGGVDGRMSKLGQTIEALKKSIKDTELEREVKIIENAGANIDAYFQAVGAGASRAEAEIIAFAQAKADAFVGAPSASVAPDGGNAGGASTSSSPAVDQAMIDAQKIIDIHSAKFQQIQMLGQSAFESEQALMIAKSDADIAQLEIEQQRMLDSAELQGANRQQLDDMDAYYEQLKIDRAQQTADAIGQTYAASAQQLVSLESNKNNAIGALQSKASQQGLGILQMFAGKSKAIALLLTAIHTAQAVADIQTTAATAAAQVEAYTAVAAMNAMAQLGPIAGPPAALAIEAAGAAQLARIGATAAIGSGLAIASGVLQGVAALKGGGDNAAPTFLANPAAGLPATGQAAPISQTPAPQQPAQQITVIIDGTTSVDHIVNDLVPAALRDQVLNNDTVIIDPRSRQAALIQQAA